MPLFEDRYAVMRAYNSGQIDCRSKSAWLSTGKPLVEKWFATLKDWESADTFERAFTQNRMTIRGMAMGDNQKSAVRREKNKAPSEGEEEVPYDDTVTEKELKLGAIGKFQVPKLGQARNPATDRYMNTFYGIKGIQARNNPENFRPGHSRKNELGLHDLSATLLHCDRPIFNQLKYYAVATCVFMPMPLQDDMALFYLLNKESKEPGVCPEFRQYIREIAGKFTRIKYAQAADMHTTYVDIGGLDSLAEPKIRYGIGGKVGGAANESRGGVSTERDVMKSDILRRRELAIRYQSILSAEDKKTGANEIVIAYRSHGNGDTPSQFPMFAEEYEWKKSLIVINTDAVRQTTIIKNTGEVVRT